MSDITPEATATDQSGDLSVAPGANDGAITCPECGEQLVDMPHREKHAILHYGDDLIPPYPDQNVAAERKAQLLNVDPSTLRGFPRRGF